MNSMEDLRRIGVSSLNQIVDRRQRTLSESTSVEKVPVDTTDHKGKHPVTEIPTAPVFSTKGINNEGANKNNKAVSHQGNGQEELIAAQTSESQVPINHKGEQVKLKFQEETIMENTLNPGIPMPLPGGMPLPIAPAVPIGAPIPAPGGLTFGGLAPVQNLSIKVVGRIARYKNCATKAINSEVAKQYYEEHKADTDVLKLLAENNYTLPKINKNGLEDPDKKEIFQQDTKDNKFSIGRFKILFPTKFAELEKADTYKVDMSEDNVEFYVFRAYGVDSNEKLIEVGRISEGEFAYLRKTEVFELMKATTLKAFDIEGAVEKAQLYIGVSHKTKDGKKEAVPTLKVMAGEKASVKLAATVIPHIALRDRGNKEVTVNGEFINEAVFQKHYPGSALPVHPAIVLEPKTAENAARNEQIRKAMEISFDQQDATTLAALGINAAVYNKLMKPSKGGNTRQKVIAEQQKGFNALMKQGSVF